jgi:hypothetical protein
MRAVSVSLVSGLVSASTFENGMVHMSCMRVVAGCVLTSLLASPPTARAQQVETGESDRWRVVVSKLEPAAFVSVRLKNGSHVKGTVLGVDERTFAIKPKTRIPVAARDLPFDDVVSIERTREGLNPGSKVLIGAAGVVGGLFVLVAIALAAWD